MVDLGRRALIDASGDTPASRAYSPDVVLINFYDEHARMGMHRDKDERTDDPGVSLSIGNSCVSASETPRPAAGRTPISSSPWATCACSAAHHGSPIMG